MDLAVWVKEQQKSSQEVKERWQQWCDLYNGGKFDPNRASEETLQGFYDCEQNGGSLDLSEFEELLLQVKSSQRMNPHLREVWSRHCLDHSGGIRDPNRHDEGSLRLFLEVARNSVRPAPSLAPAWLRHTASRPAPFNRIGRSLPPPPLHLAMMGGRIPAKGTRPFSAGPAVARFGFGDAVSTVKYCQRNSESFRQAWTWYTGAHGTGKNDPSLYDEAFVIRFIESLASNFMSEAEETEDVKREVSYEPPSKRQRRWGDRE